MLVLISLILKNLLQVPKKNVPPRERNGPGLRSKWAGLMVPFTIIARRRRCDGTSQFRHNYTLERWRFNLTIFMYGNLGTPVFE